MTPSFQALAKTLSPKAYAALANAFRSGTTLTGGAAINSAAKLLKGNAITAVVTTAVLTSFDVKDIVLGRISGAQLAVNFAKTTTTVVGGTAGWLGGSTVGTMVLPGVGTVVGGLVGSLVAGGGLGVLIDKATRQVLRLRYRQDDQVDTGSLPGRKRGVPPEPRRGREDIGQACG